MFIDLHLCVGSGVVFRSKNCLFALHDSYLRPRCTVEQRYRNTMLSLLLNTISIAIPVVIAAVIYYKWSSGRFNIADYDLTDKVYVITGATSGEWVEPRGYRLVS